MFIKSSLGLMSALSGMALLFAAVPTGTNYKLESYGLGSGGTANSTSSSYAMEGITGEVSGTQMSGTLYNGGTGMVTTQLANVPAAPTLTNPNNYYNKLNLVIDNGGNASDATFAVAVSTDNFFTTQYVQSDFTLGPVLGSEDYQTYTLWGGSSGVTIAGLSANTTYKAKVRAMHGKFTESGYSAVATAATVYPSLTFDLDISATDTETAAPYAMAFNDLSVGTVINSPQKIWVDFDTNGDFGGNVYMYGQNAGLRSTAVAYTIAAITGNLAAVQQGFGAQSTSASQTSGGPFTVSSPYDGTSDSVGITDTNIRRIYSAAAPITAGRSSLQLKAKITSTTPASSDYAEKLTVVAAPSF
jgi:hypothetical protein